MRQRAAASLLYQSQYAEPAFRNLLNLIFLKIVGRILAFYKYERPDTTWTSEKGEFSIQQSSFPSEKMILKFTDVDGSENGEYSVEQVEVPLIRKEENQDGWMVGKYAADDIQVELNPVAAEESI